MTDTWGSELMERWNSLVREVNAMDYNGEPSKRPRFRAIMNSMRDIAIVSGLDFEHYLRTGEMVFEDGH